LNIFIIIKLELNFVEAYLKLWEDTSGYKERYPDAQKGHPDTLKGYLDTMGLRHSDIDIGYSDT